MPKTVLFDLDGTLLNTLDDLAGSVNHVLLNNGFAAHTLEDIRLFVGNGVGLLVRRALPAGTPDEIYSRCFAEFTQYYKAHMRDKTAEYEGITPLLKALRSRGVRIGVVSNKLDGAVSELCGHYFGGLIEAAVGETIHVRKKPAPDTVIEALKRLGEDKAGAVFVGDSDVDIKTAANAGIRCISITWGFRTKEFLVECGAQTLADTPQELLSLLV